MKAAIYARYSTDHQREASIDDQVRNCTQYAGREDMGIIQVYQDKAVSGATSARQGYQAMLADAEAGAFNVLLVDDLSRLSRDDYEMKGVLRRLSWWGVRVIGVTDGYDSDRKGHKIHAGFKGLMNEMFIDDLRERTHRGMTGQAMKGHNCGGRTYGYRNVPIEDKTRKDAHGRPMIIAVRYEIEEEQAEVVRGIYRDYANGLSYRAIASALNAKKVPSSRGSSWAQTAIKVILENEMYEGRLIWNKRQWVKHPETGKRTYKDRPQSEWIIKEDQALRIVDAETIAKVRKRQSRNKEAYGGESIQPITNKFLFSGLLRCAECGSSFTITGHNRYGCSKHKTRGEHACSNSKTVSRHIVEERLLAGIKKQLREPGYLEIFKKEAVKALEALTAENNQDHIRGRLHAAQREHDNIMNAIRQGIITESTKEALEKAEKEVVGLRQELEQAEQMNIASILPRAVERYQQAIDHLEKELSGHVGQAREAIRSVIGEEIIIHRRGEYLEAELQNSMTAILSQAVGGHSDLLGCGGRI